MKKRAVKIAFRGMLAALALVLAYVEALMPAFFAIPGIKPGLTNIVVVFALYMIGEGDALGINIVRIMLSAMMFTGGAALIYSLCGGILSFIVMTALKRTGSFGICAVSAAGGVAHNTGQIAAAVFLLRSRMIVWYLPPLWIAGVVSGLLVGLVSGLVCIKLKNIDIYPFL